MPKSRKSANGEGSIYYRRDRKRWEGSLTVGTTTDGRPSRRTVTGRTRAEVIDRMANLRRSIEAGPGLPAEVTVGRWLNHWLLEVLPLTDTAPTTRDNYADVVRLYVEPTIGRVRLDQLQPAHVRSMLARLRDQGLSSNTQRAARSVLRRSLRAAEVDGLVTRNVAALVDGVRVQQPEGRTLTPDQARDLLAAVRGDRHEALVVLLLSLGLRRGEALGLGWDDLQLDREQPTLTVRRALKKVKRTADRPARLVLEEPKTATSRRTVHLPQPTADLLRRHRAGQAAERLAYGTGWGAEWAAVNLVFTTTIGTAVDPDNFAKALGRITVAAGLGTWTPHELRHSAASLLIAQGVPLKVVSETLGHSSIRVTADVYGHLLEPAKVEAAAAMTTALWGAQ